MSTMMTRCGMLMNRFRNIISNETINRQPACMLIIRILRVIHLPKIQLLSGSYSTWSINLLLKSLSSGKLHATRAPHPYPSWKMCIMGAIFHALLLESLSLTGSVIIIGLMTKKMFTTMILLHI